MMPHDLPHSTDIGVIINPISGAHGRPDAGAQRAALASALLARHGARAAVAITSHAGHACELSEGLLASGCTLILAWGGDGTINEVASVLVRRGRGVLGVIPAGSGNGLARELGISRRPAAAIASLLSGQERSIDAVELDGRLLFNVGGIGLDAEVARRVNLYSSGRRGTWPYVKGALTALASAQPRRYSLTADGRTLTRDALFVSIANGTQYGIGARIAPAARLDDGLVDVVVVEGSHALRTVWRARRLFSGAVEQDAGVTTIRTHAFSIAADGPIAYHVDGEVFVGGETLACRVLPRALRVRVPCLQPS
jgi:YegS/Rv2252/BmrU family lipid kinase